MEPCKYCSSPVEKSHELPLDTLLLCQLTKYEYLSELVDMEKKSHCIKEFENKLKYSKEPIEGTTRGIYFSEDSFAPIMIGAIIALLIAFICKYFSK